MRSPDPRGHTLLEVTTLLALLAVASSALAAGFRRALDRLAVEGAREEVAALIARGRMEAVLRGGATVVVTEDPARATLVVEAPDDDLDGEPSGPVVRLSTSDLGLEHGILLETGGADGRVELSFDALGLGLMASRSLRFRRGGAEAGLVVSGYGRIRRR